ncbi:Heat shock protein SSB [Fasciolopsis buskii]|uniref:Heat shock protein SSB n=1 Tax=Fasciolopsis buskii TaxID=27845 RepID=A0A8E0RN67_9TREM|nr:Heat shock protein SSB [Fasciolopsis buski]
MPVIGIDLGNTYSCMAVYRVDKPDVIHNHRTFRNTPNWIAFSGSNRYVGDDAKGLALSDAPNTVYDAHRMIGRSYSEVAEMARQSQWPFEVIANRDDNPLVRVMYCGNKHTYSPEELISMILRYLVECAEDVLGESVRNVVLTVPSAFNDSQRKAVRRAGEMAGLIVLRLLRESTAAAIAFNHIGLRVRNKTVLIYDFGGGTTDATVIQVTQQIITSLFTARDDQLGGVNIDQRLAEYFLNEIREQYHCNFESDTRVRRQLLVYCEKLKIQLSSAKQAEIEIASHVLLPDQSITLSLTRDQFELYNKDLFEKSLKVIRTVLKNANLKPSNVNEILLVGGSTRIPKVREMVQNFFPGKPVNMSLNPGEAIACGAAIVAANLAKIDSPELHDLMLYEITVLDFSIGQFGGIVDVFIPRYTPLPAGVSKMFGTSYDNQTEVTVTVFEGNRVMQKDNRLLTTITLSGIRPAPWGEAKLKVTLKVDENKCLYVCVAEMPDGVREEVIISRDVERTSKEYFARMISDAEQNKDLDKIYLVRRNRWYGAYRYAVKATFVVQSAYKEKRIDEDSFKRMLAKCNKTVAWFLANETADQSEYRSKIHNLEIACHPLLKDYADKTPF